MYDFGAPVWMTYFHRFIPSKMRATIGSMEGMLRSLAGVIALPLTGLLVDTIGGRLTIFVSTLLSIPIIILYTRIKEKKT